MRLQALRIFVSDLAEARRFYSKIVGLEIKWEWQARAIGFDLGVELIVELVDADVEDDDRALVGRFTGASIQVEDIEVAYTALVGKSVRFTGAPERQPWGGMLAHFKDPGGNVLTLFQA